MILVTGGLGFIGSNFVCMGLEGLLPEVEGQDFIILDNQTYAGRITNLGVHGSNPRINIINGDIRNEELVDNLVKEASEIIHFAAESHVDRSIEVPDIFIQTNIVGTGNLIKSADGWKKRLVVVSTDEVYGSLNKGEAKEEDTLNPSSPYSASKAAGDLLALSFFKTFGTDVVITRSTNNYGRNQHEEKFLPTVISRIINGERIPIYGNGRNIRNWIHVEDHCRGIASVLKFGISGEIYNFGTADYYENLQICEILLAHRGQSLGKISFVKDRRGHDFRYGVNSEKARTQLNWKPENNFMDTVENLFNWYSH
jgi:dTDP-glucose 4,6-dehydratase